MAIGVVVLRKIRPSLIVAKVFVLLLFVLNQAHAETDWYGSKSISYDFNNDGIGDVVSLVLKENDIVHLKLRNGIFYNGRLFEAKDSYLIIHDRRDGRKKVFYIDIVFIDEFTESGK